MHAPIRPAIAGLLLLGCATAQNGFGATRHDLPFAPTGFLRDVKIVHWIAEDIGQPNVMVAGSQRTNLVSTLTRPNPLQALQIGRLPVIVQEQGTDNYFGVTMEGSWAPLLLGAPAQNLTYSQDLVTLESGGTIHCFQPWRNAWISEPLQNPNFYAIIAGRALSCVVDGTDSVIGFSKLGVTRATRLNLPPDPNRLISQIGGTGETDTRRNSQIFEIGTNEIAAYSPYIDAWSRHTFPTPVALLNFEYDKNNVRVVDPVRNEMWFYSAVTGGTQRLVFADVSQVLIDSQDFGIYAIDPVSTNVFFFRSIDAGLSVLFGAANDITRVEHGNNLLALEVTDPVTGAIEYHGCSSSTTAGQFVPAGFGAGETVLGVEDNDNVFVMATDAALYGFSGFSNNWTILRNYQGVYQSRNAQDFIGQVQTDTHVYVFSAREDRWVSRAIGGGASVDDTDTMVIVSTAGAKACYSMDSTAWRVQQFRGPLFLDGRENSYAFSLHDDPTTGGSRLWFFSSLRDQWIEYALPNRVTDPLNVILVEDGLLIVDGSSVHAFSGFADLTTPYTAPLDNYAYHAFPGAQVQFVAVGRPNATAFLFAGLNRTSLTLPGITGEILIDPNFVVGVNAGSYDARGVLRFSADLTGAQRGTVRMQMLSVDANLDVELGRLLNFEIF